MNMAGAAKSLAEISCRAVSTPVLDRVMRACVVIVTLKWMLDAIVARSRRRYHVMPVKKSLRAVIGQEFSTVTRPVTT